MVLFEFLFRGTQPRSLTISGTVHRIRLRARRAKPLGIGLK